MTPILPHDVIDPSITILCTSTSYSSPKLNKLEANYKSWLKSTDLFLTLARFIGYAKGTIPKPSNSEPCAQSNWQANDTVTTALISSTIDTAEWEYIDKGAKNCWDTLKARYQSEGPIWQVQLLQEALTTQCDKSTPLPVTVEKICSAIDHAYDMGEISKDLMMCIMLLSSLGQDFQHLHSIITQDIVSDDFVGTPMK